MYTYIKAGNIRYAMTLIKKCWMSTNGRKDERVCGLCLVALRFALRVGGTRALKGVSCSVIKDKERYSDFSDCELQTLMQTNDAISNDYAGINPSQLPSQPIPRIFFQLAVSSSCLRKVC